MITPLDIAKSQIGLAEATGNNDGLPCERFAGGRSEPWCAHFIAWCFRSAGVSIPGDIPPTKENANPLASVEFMERVFKEHEWFYRQPKVGDIIFFKNRGASDAGGGRHCGIVSGVDRETVTTIEGNLGNSVKQVCHRLDSPRISGYGRISNKE